jgi:hypothetical protein
VSADPENFMSGRNDGPAPKTGANASSASAAARASVERLVDMGNFPAGDDHRRIGAAWFN